MRFILFWIFGSLTTCSLVLAQSNGGATTVGDGGHVIQCGNQQEVFDLFEYRISNDTDAAISLADDGQSNLKDMVNTGLKRIQFKFSLSESEYARVQRAAKMFLLDNTFNRGASMGWLRQWRFSARSISVSKAVYDIMVTSNCTLKTVVVRPPMNSSFFSSICSRYFSEVEFCFITNTDLFWDLSREQAACLVVHEVLRFLPEQKKLNERQLRTATAEICTL